MVMPDKARADLRGVRSLRHRFKFQIETPNRFSCIGMDDPNAEGVAASDVSIREAIFYSPLCCNSLLTKPVQPVWWLAPTPRPVSP
jgi:hypothetical protein